MSDLALRRKRFGSEDDENNRRSDSKKYFSDTQQVIHNQLQSLRRSDGKYKKDDIIKILENIINDKKVHKKNLKYINSIKDKLYDSRISTDQAIEELKNLTTSISTEKFVDDYLKTTQAQDFKYRKGYEELAKTLTPQLEYFTASSQSLHEILEKIVSEIVQDKIKLGELKNERFQLMNKLKTFNEKIEVIKTGYRRVTTENSNLYKAFEQQQEEITQLQIDLHEQKNINNQYRNITRSLTDKRRAILNKVDSMSRMLSNVDNRMKYQLENFMPQLKTAEIEQLEKSLYGGGDFDPEEKKKINEILEKLDITRDTLYAINLFYNKKIKKKYELISFANILDIDVPLIKNISKIDLLELICKRLKVLTKKEASFIKNMDFFK